MELTEKDLLKIKNYDANSLDVAEEGNNFVLSFANGVYLKVTDSTLKFLSKLDGTKPIDEIIKELKEEEGIYLKKEEVETFIYENLSKNCLLTNEEYNNKNGVIPDGSQLWFHFPLFRGESINAILKPFSVLFNKVAVISSILLFIVLQMYFVFDGFYNDINFNNVLHMNTAGTLVIVFVSFILHEMGHAAAGAYYNIRIGNMGVGIYLFRPVFYTDLSEAWKLSRKKRMVTNFGGLYFQIVYAALLSVILLVTNAFIIKISIILIVVSVLMNLDPILRLDGYWILSDLFGVVNVNDRAFDMLVKVIQKIFTRKDIDLGYGANIKKNVRMFVYIYSFIYVVSTLIALFFGVFIVGKILVNYPHITDLVAQVKDCIVNKDILGFLSKMNNLLVLLLPLIYFVIMIIYNVHRIKNRNRFRGTNKNKATAS
jgi:putative peptide zinc metalloprotease protein